MAVVFTALALSPVVTFQDALLFTIPLSETVLDYLSVFRASGRFIWPIYYAMYIFTVREIALYYQKIKAAEKKVKDNSKQKSVGTEFVVFMFILTTVFVQVNDLTPMFDEKNRSLRRTLYTGRH
jgi:hypothetical protein